MYNPRLAIVERREPIVTDHLWHCVDCGLSAAESVGRQLSPGLLVVGRRPTAVGCRLPAVGHLLFIVTCGETVNIKLGTEFNFAWKW